MSKIFEFLFELEFRGGCVTERTEHAQAESAEQRKSGRERVSERVHAEGVACVPTHPLGWELLYQTK